MKEELLYSIGEVLMTDLEGVDDILYEGVLGSEMIIVMESGRRFVLKLKKKVL